MFSRRRAYSFIGLSCIICLSICSCDSKISRQREIKPDHTAHTQGLVVSTHYLASEVGRDILAQGGNAVDAAVAVSFALAVVYPEAGNIGGGGFLVMRTEDGESTTIDFRETAPAKAGLNMYLDESGEAMAEKSRLGALAVGVPGSVAGMLYSLEKYGTMSAATVIAPAIKLAREGFILDGSLGGHEFERFPSTARTFNKGRAIPHAKGERFFQQDLAWTLEKIANEGRDGFYKGEVANLILGAMEEHGGLITREDLASYTPIERPPIEGKYRDYGIISMAPPSSGGICLVQLLHMLENYDINAMGWNTPETVHLMVEAEKRSYADRAHFLGDPDFTCIPSARLVSPDYARVRVGDIKAERATPSTEVSHGDIPMELFECPQTTHYSVVDKEGTCVAVTTTLNGRFGSLLVVDGAGFLLNNQMDDFSSKVGSPNMYGLTGGEANAIAPNKRMLSSMAPTIVTKNSQNHLVIGTPGGSTIITTVLQCILNVVDHGMNIQEAVAAPRFHHQWYPDAIQYEEKRRGLTQTTIMRLEELGHLCTPRDDIGVAQGILIDRENNCLKGGADPRCPTSRAVGY